MGSRKSSGVGIALSAGMAILMVATGARFAVAQQSLILKCVLKSNVSTATDAKGLKSVSTVSSLEQIFTLDMDGEKAKEFPTSPVSVSPFEITVRSSSVDSDGNTIRDVYVINRQTGGYTYRSAGARFVHTFNGACEPIKPEDIKRKF